MATDSEIPRRVKQICIRCFGETNIVRDFDSPELLWRLRLQFERAPIEADFRQTVCIDGQFPYKLADKFRPFSSNCQLCNAPLLRGALSPSLGHSLAGFHVLDPIRD